MMTRKDYIATAQIMSQFKTDIPQITFEDLVFEFADFFAADNPNFNPSKFETACMKEYEVA